MPFESGHIHRNMLRQGDSEDAWKPSAVMFHMVQMAIIAPLAGSTPTFGVGEGAVLLQLESDVKDSGALAGKKLLRYGWSTI
jgi:hypothetical protein